MEPGSSTPGGARGSPRTAAGLKMDRPNQTSGADAPSVMGAGAGRPIQTPGADAPLVIGRQDSFSIEVILADPAWRRLLPRAEVLARRAAVAAFMEAGAGTPSRHGGDGSPEGIMTILLTDDREMRRLNFQHRGKDKPTNVLSFPGAAPGHLGDIALALGVVRREAMAAGRSPVAHVSHLVAHGTLHLLGHDHLTAGEARRMEQAEARALARLGLPNPWKAAGTAARWAA